MAYEKIITLDQIHSALYEGKGIYNMVNRSFDGYIVSGASKVRIPATPLLTAVTPPATNRKKVKADSDMIDVIMQKSVVEIEEEVEAQYETKGKMLQAFINDSAKAHAKNFDAAVITEAQTACAAANRIDWDADDLTWKDILNVKGKLIQSEVPDENILIFVPATLHASFNSIDVIKSASAFNQNYMETGVLKIQGMTIVVTARCGQYGGKDNIVGCYSQGIAFLLGELMDRKEVYDSVNKSTDVDYFAWFGVKQLKDVYSVVCSKKVVV